MVCYLYTSTTFYAGAQRSGSIPLVKNKRFCGAGGLLQLGATPRLYFFIYPHFYLAHEQEKDNSHIEAPTASPILE